MRRRATAPTNGRRACGATRPTKGTEPATAVAPPATSAARERATMRARWTRTPSDAASSSPEREDVEGAADHPEAGAPAEDEDGGDGEMLHAAALQPAREPEEHDLHAELLRRRPAAPRLPAPANAETAMPVSSSPATDDRPRNRASA